jgi:hypothetical protein
MHQNKLLKIYRRHWRWVAFFAVLLPALLSFVMAPEWLGRIIAVGAIFYLLPMIVIVTAFWAYHDPAIRFLSKDSMAFRQWGIRAELGIWLCAFLFTGAVIFDGSLSYTKDILQVAKEGRPTYVIQGTVSGTAQSLATGMGFFDQRINLVGTSTDFSLMFHKSLAYGKGEKFEFIVLPNSNVILEVHPIE